MNNEKKMTPHERGLWIVDSLRKLLENLQATVPEHQARFEALSFLEQRLKKLDQLENEPQIIVAEEREV